MKALLKSGLALTAIAIALGTAPADAKKAKVIKQIPVSADFTSAELAWLGRPQPGFRASWATKVIGGEIAICGAVAYGDIQLRPQSQAVLRRSYIAYQGKRIMKDMTFFARVSRVKNLSSATANCASTGVKAPGGRYDVRFGWDRGSAKG